MEWKARASTCSPLRMKIVPRTAVAKPDSGVDKRARQEVEVEHGAADRLQDVGGRRLLREQFFEIARFGLHLVEQPRILDGDNSLVGESLQKFNLARVERTNGLPGHDEAADRLAFAQEGNREQSAEIAAALIAGLRIFGVRQHVRNVHGAPIAGRSRHAPLAPGGTGWARA